MPVSNLIVICAVDLVVSLGGGLITSWPLHNGLLGLQSEQTT